MKTLKIWKQQSWNEQHDIHLTDNGDIHIDNVKVNSPREIALANIILRLNAQLLDLQKWSESSRRINRFLLTSTV